MTVAALKQYGREGGMMIRARIEGCPIDWCTHTSMASLTPVAGRTRRHGLSFAGAKITQKVDLAKCTVEASGLTLKITDHSQVASVLFACEPEETWMTPGTLDDVSTTLVVASTAGFDASGYLWIDTEAMSYSSLGTTVDEDGVTRGTFEGLGRGALGTLAQYHYSAGDASSGRNLRYPSVTNRPATFEGRRVTLYAYGRGDDPQGDGTQFWTGIVLRDPRMSGAEWSISCDPISKVLDAELGGDLGDAQPRGIHYPGAALASTSPEFRARFLMSVFRQPYAGGASTAIPNPYTDISLRQAPIYFPHPDFVSAENPNGGFFESQTGVGTGAASTTRDFVDAVNIQIAALTSGWGTTIECLPYVAAGEPDRYYFKFTAGANPDGVSLGIAYTQVYDGNPTHPPRTDAIDPIFNHVTITPSASSFDPDDVVSAMAAGTTYYSHPSPISVPGAGSVPRGIVQLAPNSSAEAIPDASAQTLYLGGTISPTGDTTAARIAWASGDESTIDYRVAGNSSTLRSLTLERDEPGGTPTERTFTSANVPTIKLGRTYEYDAIHPLGTYNVIKAIEADCPEYVNLGIMPVIRAGDWTGEEFTGAWFNEYFFNAPPPIATFRRYTSFKSQKLLDLITPDLQLLGAFLAFDSIGRLTIKRLRPALTTEVPALRITAFSKGSWPSYERSPFGSINTWVLQDGFDPIEDKSTGIPFVVRDVTAYGRNPTPRSLSVKPRSVYYGPTTTYDDAADAAQPLFSIYASPYVIVQGSVPLTALDAVLGSAVTVSTSLLPGTAGLRGMSATGMITSREIDLYGATIELEILISLSGAAGYAPSALVTSYDMTGDDEYDLTLSADYFRPGETAADHFLVGDSVRVYPFDAAPGTGGDQSGTVYAASGNVISVNLGGGSLVNLLPAPGSVTWTGIDSPTITTGQADPLGGTNAVAVLDNSGSFESMRTNEVAYVSGADLRCEVWIKKDAGATSFAEIRVGIGGTYPNDGVNIDPVTGAAQVRVSSAAYYDIESTEAITGWWRVRFTRPGAAGATVGMRVWPAWGTAYPTSAAGATGTVTFYAPHISYTTWTPGVSEWVLAFDALGTTTANMKRYGWAADETLRIDFVTDPDRGALKFSASG